jgi:hypothetical protein
MPSDCANRRLLPFAFSPFASCLLPLAVCLSPAAAQTSYPMITHTMPVAVQRGRTTEVTVEGKMNFAGVHKVLLEGQGIAAEVVPAPTSPGKLPPPTVSTVKLKLTVAADAALGVRDFRVASNLGLSSIGQLVVVDEPVVVESGLNNTPDKANPIQVPCAVCGRIEAAEDVDFFKFHAEAGQTFTFEVFCARLQDKIHDLQKHADPLLTLFDADGRELAANDDFYFADPLLAFTFSQSGEYFLQIRDSKYEGDPRWVYAILATDRPYVSHVFPMAGNPGTVIEVEPVGPARKLRSRVPLRVPEESGLHQVQLDIGGVRTNPTAFIVSPLPQVMEVEPNDTPAQATRVSIPCGINGRIGAPRDLDYFRFAAVKGKAIRFEVKARRFGTLLRSSLDSFLEVLSLKGDVLANNDDTYGKDSALVFTPQSDGDFLLRIRDLNSKGGATAVYYIEADWARPDFSLRCDPEKAMIGPGSSTAWFVHVDRANGFDQPVRIDIKGLPHGVTASPLTIPPTMTQGVVVLTAAPDAPRDATNVQVIGTATVNSPDGASQDICRTATANQEIYLPGGGRGSFDVQLQSVAVTDPSDILKVEVSPKTLSLKPGEEARIDVTVQRRPDHMKAVSLDVLLQHLGRVYGNPLPPGVTVVEAKSKTLLGTGNQGHIVLKAAPNAAPIDDVPISVQAFVSINFVVKIDYSSQPIALRVVAGQ